MNLAFLPNLAGPDGILILLIVLLLFGAKKLPELARGMGQAVREFSKAKDDMTHEITRAPELPTPPRQVDEPKYVDQHKTEVAGDMHSQDLNDPHHPHTNEPAPTRIIS